MGCVYLIVLIIFIQMIKYAMLVMVVVSIVSVQQETIALNALMCGITIHVSKTALKTTSLLEPSLEIALFVIFPAGSKILIHIELVLGHLLQNA